MKQLAGTLGSLRALKWGTRFAYTLFLAFIFVGYLVMALLAAERSGFSSEQIVGRYVGDDQTSFGMSYGEMLEVTHFHLFSMPLLLFVMGHLFLLSFWPLRVKVSLVIACAVGMVCDLSAPWLIHYVSSDFAQLKNIGRVLMGAGFLAFTLVPIWEMWFRRSPAVKADDSAVS